MSYFVLTPNRLARVSAASRAIFGHLGSDASLYGPGKAAGRRSPRPYLHKKLKGGKISRLGWPFLRPQLLEGRWYRHEEERLEAYEERFQEEREAERAEEAAREGTFVKKEPRALTKGKKRQPKE